MIRLPQWQFVEDENHQRHWTCVAGHVRVVSIRLFLDRIGCLFDAVQNVGAARTVSTFGEPSALSRKEPPLYLSVRYSVARLMRAH
jgi:hypothetical protein